VAANGAVDGTLSKGITQSMEFTGGGSSYCFKGLPFQPKGGAATISYPDSTGAGTLAQLQISTTGTTGDCTGGAQVEVATYLGGSFVKEPFYIVLYG
jgi:hypothetical protein